MVSGPELALALVIAQRNVPSPLSAVLVTVNVLPRTGPAGHKKANPASVASQHPAGRAGRNRKWMILLIGKLCLILYMGKGLDSMLLDQVLMDFSVILNRVEGWVATGTQPTGVALDTPRMICMICVRPKLCGGGSGVNRAPSHSLIDASFFPAAFGWGQQKTNSCRGPRK